MPDSNQNTPFQTLADDLTGEGETLLLRADEQHDPIIAQKFPNAPSVTSIAFQQVIVEEGDQFKYLVGCYMMASRGEPDLFFLCPKPIKARWWTQGYESPKSLLLADRFTLFDSLQQIAEVMPTIDKHYAAQLHIYSIYQVIRDEARNLSLKQIFTEH
jgi:hypothetical protein